MTDFKYISPTIKEIKKIKSEKQVVCSEGNIKEIGEEDIFILCPKHNDINFVVNHLNLAGISAQPAKPPGLFAFAAHFRLVGEKGRTGTDLAGRLEDREWPDAGR
ncbi:MAG: hypothetical protein IH789_13275, partial [Acidobacteria bacterium]|nr:hypothetical protein [Acidobacteriota bacterium]